MTNEELLAKIKAEIERLKEKAERRPHATPLEGFECMGKIKVCNELLSFLSTLESEKQMQKGLDVTDFCKPIDPSIAQCIADHFWEMLGEDEKPMNQEGLEKEINRYFNAWQNVQCDEDCSNEGGFCCVLNDELKPVSLFHCRKIARHFAKWGAEHSGSSEIPNDHLEHVPEIKETGTQGLDEADEKPVPADLEEAAEKYAVNTASYYYKEADDEVHSNFDELKSAFIVGSINEREKILKEAVEYEVGMHGEPIKITFDKYVQRARGIFPGDKVRIIIVKED